MVYQMTQQEMAQYDAQEFAVVQERDRIAASLDGFLLTVHRMLDKRRGRGWTLTDAEIEAKLADLAAGGNVYNPSIRTRPSELIRVIAEARDAITALNRNIGELEDWYLTAGAWQRYFPCLNRDGHIHASLRGCPTVRWDTDMGWATEMSGLTPDQAIHQGIPGQFPGLGETLCTVCFPEAPAEWCRTRSEVTRAEREAARAAKNAARDAAGALKNLAEVFRTHDGERITTVAALKGVVRKPAETVVEIEWYETSALAREAWNGMEDRLAQFIARAKGRLEGEEEDMRQACAILAAREAAAPGSGWTEEEADKAVASATRRARKAYFG